MRLRRSSAPSSPGFVHASASARSCRFSLAENRRRLAVATTSGSGARPAAGAAPSLALRAPCGAAPAVELTCVLINESIPFSVMSGSACTLNCPRQVSQLILARGALCFGLRETEIREDSPAALLGHYTSAHHRSPLSPKASQSRLSKSYLIGTYKVSLLVLFSRQRS